MELMSQRPPATPSAPAIDISFFTTVKMNPDETRNNAIRSTCSGLSNPPMSSGTGVAIILEANKQAVIGMIEIACGTRLSVSVTPPI